MEGITTLEVQLHTMRMLWMKAHEDSSPDLELAKQACVIANDAAPYCHPRSQAILIRRAKRDDKHRPKDSGAELASRPVIDQPSGATQDGDP